jgi:hypothetical protein
MNAEDNRLPVNKAVSNSAITRFSVEPDWLSNQVSELIESPVPLRS